MEDLEAESSEMVEEEFNSQIEQGKSLSERFREELESYLTELEAKVSADGESLVSKPDNFDAIVNSMTREDLLDKTSIGGQPTWYDSMIQDHVSKKLDRDFQGRYHHVFSDSHDQKIRKGMAEILMLDRQLYQITKKAQQLANENIIAPESVPTTPGSSRQDRTFMTKHKTDDESFAISESNRKSSNHNGSPRRQPSPPRSAKKSGRKVAFQAQDEVKMTKEQQQQRLEELLCIDDLTFESSLAFIDQEYIRDMQEIDETLAHFGHLDRLTNTDRIEPEKDNNAPPRDDYLAQRRQERKIEEYTARIDSLLQKTKSPDNMDYSLLLSSNDDPASSKPVPSRSSVRQALHEVPSDLNEVRPDLPITRIDIQTLLANLSEQAHEATATRTKIDEMMKEYEADMLRLQRLRAAQRHDQEMKRVMGTASSSSRPSTAGSYKQHQLEDNEESGRHLEDVSLLSMEENPFSSSGYRQQAKDESDDEDEKYFKQQQQKKKQQQQQNTTDQVSTLLLFSAADRQALQQQLEQEEQQLMSMAWLRKPVPPPPLQQHPPRSRETEELILPPIQQSTQQHQQRASQPYQPLASNRRVKQPKQVSPRTRQQQPQPRQVESTTVTVEEADFEELPSPQEQIKIQKQVLLDQVRQFVEC